jgi:phosphoglycolate phosphatase-like HAD superfamily hydrolase
MHAPISIALLRINVLDMTPRLIVFDFDGTLADTPRTFITIVNRLADEFGYNPLSDEQALQLQGLSSREIVRQSQVSVFKLPFLLRKVKREFTKEMAAVAPIPGIEKALQDLKDRGYLLGILTSNLKENVTEFLENHQLQNLFEFIYSGVTLFGKHKPIQRLLRLYDLPAEAFVYVGDETRDIEAARKSRVRSIAVTWGFNSLAILSQHHPDAVVSHPQALVEAIAQLADVKG